MSNAFLECVAEEPLLLDGGCYLELERRCVGSLADEISRAVIDYPEGVLEIHREFVRAGAEIVQAMAWGVYPGDLSGDDEAALHRQAVALAREAAGPERFVAGNLNAARYGVRTKWESMGVKEKSAAQAHYERRVEQQAAAEVDLFIVETLYGVDEAKLAIPFVKQAGLPCIVTLTFRDADYTRDGYSPGDAAKALVDAGADVVGVNCMRPWNAMSRLVREMRSAVSVPICSQPTGYELESGEYFNRALSRASMQGRVEMRVVTRFAMAEYALEARSFGVNLIGSCCGSLPYHVRAMAEALGKAVAIPDRDRGYAATS